MYRLIEPVYKDNEGDEDIARLVSLGYSHDMARIALENEGGVEEAAEALLAGEGIVTVQVLGETRKRFCDTWCSTKCFEAIIF